MNVNTIAQKVIVPGLIEELVVATTLNKVELIYFTEEFEVITKETLQGIIDELELENEVTLFTNAGIDLHSTVDNYKNINVRKLTFFQIENLKETYNL
jgi:hypothetical protein